MQDGAVRKLGFKFQQILRVYIMQSVYVVWEHSCKDFGEKTCIETFTKIFTFDYSTCNKTWKWPGVPNDFSSTLLKEIQSSLAQDLDLKLKLTWWVWVQWWFLCLCFRVPSSPYGAQSVQSIWHYGESRSRSFPPDKAEQICAKLIYSGSLGERNRLPLFTHAYHCRDYRKSLAPFFL